MALLSVIRRWHFREGMPAMMGSRAAVAVGSNVGRVGEVVADISRGAPGLAASLVKGLALQSRLWNGKD